MRLDQDQDNPGKTEMDEDDLAPQEGEIIDESAEQHRGKVRRRIKVRKKFRIRKKPSIKKKLRKMAEKTFWVLLVIGFVAALVVMIIELDIRDEKFKAKKKVTPTRIEF